MTAIVDVFWSFRSPYSYLVTPDLVRLRADYVVDVRLRRSEAGRRTSDDPCARRARDRSSRT